MVNSIRQHWLRGTFMHAPTPDAIEVLEDTIIEIGGDGRIGAIVPPRDPDRAERERKARQSGRLIEFGVDDYLIPGLVDLHVHAPQYPQLGLALDEPLEVWLQKYTFPLEARFADAGFARESYSALVNDLLGNGTTTALYFATIHQHTTTMLADICLERGQRALVGKVVMDHPESCPEYYRDQSPETAIDQTRAVIEYIRDHPANAEARVLPVVTPRFIPSCSDAALERLGALVRDYGCHMQTHCSENVWAHGHVLERHGMTDASSLDRFGLLGRRSVLAHGTQLTGQDMDLLVRRGSAIAHCPLSNAYFGDGVFPLKRAMDKGMNVGLGTDVSGGPTSSIFDSARMAIASSCLLDSFDRTNGEQRISLAAAFHLATARGGLALDLPIGKFETGYHFDALRIDISAPGGGIRRLGVSDPEHIAQKIIHSALPANIADVWVGGSLVSLQQ